MCVVGVGGCDFDFVGCLGMFCFGVELEMWWCFGFEDFKFNVIVFGVDVLGFFVIVMMVMVVLVVLCVL